MPAANTWSLLDPDKLASLGSAALASGRVSPQEAAQNAQWLSYMNSPTGQTEGMIAMGAPDDSSSSALPALKPMLNPTSLPNPGNAAASKKGSKLGASQEGKQETRSNVTRALTFTPEEFQSMANSVRQLPEMQDQQKSLNDLGDVLSMTASAPSTQEGWIKPLLALADSQTGSHLSQGFQPEMTMAQRNQMLLKYLDEIQKRKSDLSKSILEGVTKMKSGTEQNATINSLLEKLSNEQNNKIQNTQGSKVRRNQMVANAGASFDKDPILKQVTTTNNSLDRAMSMMNGSTPITGKNFALLQQDMINAMAPGGAATEGKVNREMVETLAAKLNNLMTQFGSVQDLRKEQPQVFDQLKSLINQVREDYNSAGKQRTTELAANFTDIPDPLVQSTVNRKVQMLGKKFAVPEKSQTSSAPSQGGGMVRVVSPDGRTGTIPAANLDKAISKGWKKAE